MRDNKTLTIIVILLALLIISQGVTLFFVFSKTSHNLILLNQTEIRISNQISNTERNFQSKINSLTDALSLLSSSQSDLKSEISEIKASASSDFSGIIEDNIKGAVTIKTDVAQGTGFLITNDGYILTNAHVLSGARLANIFTFDNTRYSASLIGYDSNLDIALLKISGSFQKLNLGNSDSVKLGEKVIAIGNPLGLSFTTTEGIISSRDRTGDNNLPYYFQTDVSLNPGNSGGPLINTQGEVIGINNFKISGAENIGFALEINPAKQKVNEITLKALNVTII